MSKRYLLSKCQVSNVNVTLEKLQFCSTYSVPYYNVVHVKNKTICHLWTVQIDNFHFLPSTRFKYQFCFVSHGLQNIASAVYTKQKILALLFRWYCWAVIWSAIATSYTLFYAVMRLSYCILWYWITCLMSCMWLCTLSDVLINKLHNNDIKNN